MTNKEIWGHHYILIMCVRENKFLCELNDDMKRMQHSICINPLNTGIGNSLFQYSVPLLIKHEWLRSVKDVMNVYKMSDYGRIIDYDVSPLLWSDRALPYSCYYEHYNYNKINVIKRNTGFTFAYRKSFGGHIPLYLSKQSEYPIKSILDRYRSNLKSIITSYNGYSDLYENLEKNLYEKNIIMFTIQINRKWTYYKDYKATFPFLSSNTIIQSGMSYFRVSMYKEKVSYGLDKEGYVPELDVFLTALFLAQHKGYNKISDLQNFLTEFKNGIINNIEQLEVNSLDLLVHVHRVDKENSKEQHQIFNLTSISMSHDKPDSKGWKNRFALLTSKSLIDTNQLDMFLYTNSKVQKIFDLIDRANYSKLGVYDYDFIFHWIRQRFIIIYE